MESHKNKPLIIYSLASHGLGHASRFTAIADICKDLFQFHVFCDSKAYTFLSNKYQNHKDIQVFKLTPSLNIKYDPTGHADWVKSIIESQYYLFNLTKQISLLKKHIKHTRPVLAISDLEAALPKAADNLPTLTIASQNRFLLPMEGLNSHLRMKCNLIKLYNQLTHYPYTVALAPSYGGHSSKQFKNIIPCGPIIKKTILEHPIQEKDFILVYLHNYSCNKNVLEKINKCRIHSKIYGFKKPNKNYQYLEFCEMSSENFAKDATQCMLYISNAGAQSIGEMRFLGKKMIVCPEKRQIEQELSAALLKRIDNPTQKVVEDYNNIEKEISEILKLNTTNRIKPGNQQILNQILVMMAQSENRRACLVNERAY